MTCALCAAMMLSGCGDKEAVDTNNTPDTTPPVVEDQITIPEDTTTPENNTDATNPDETPSDNTETPSDNTETPTPDDSQPPVVLNTTSYVFPNTNIELTVPDSWMGNYYVKEVTHDNSAYPTAEFYYFGKGAENFGSSNAMMFMSVSSKDGLIKDLGEDFMTKLGPKAQVVGEYMVPTEDGNLDTYLVILNWPDNGDIAMPEDYVKMVTESQDPNMIYCYIPAPVIVDEAAKPFVEAIESARSEEDNLYVPLVANMAQDAFYLEAMQLNAADVEAFAIGLPMMNVRAYNVSIIKPVEGKGDAVKAGLEKYVEATVQSFENYLVDQLEVAKGAIIEEVNGAYVLVMCENAQQVFDSIKASLTA